ncbi:MAG: long-chain fatty acid--CoA ligase [Chloroflexi bacterium]|nr:long-chain fatty acid--CoA ligase [Chloroflexota bacterium]
MVLGTWITDRGRLTPDRVAIDHAQGRVTYRQLDRESAHLAAELLERGLRRGDRVAVLSDNRPEYVTLFFACARIGLILTPLNWRLAAPELAYQLDHSEPALLVVSEERRSQAMTALGVARVQPPLRDIAEPPAAAVATTAISAARVAVRNDDPLLLCYTSGTSGRPKGALLTHANCFWTNLSIDHLMDVTTFDVVLQVLPQFHVGGWNVQPLLAWWKGATVVLESSFDARRALALIESKRVTTMMGVPATYLFMAEHPTFATTDLSSLRMAVVGGAPMPEALLRTWLARGVRLVQGYGLTEAGPNVLALPWEDATAHLGAAGKAYPHVEVALADAAGEPLDGPASGELLVRGPNVFAGYWRDPDATAAAMRDGWLHTGDIAERDADGFHRIRGRIKEMYISGGENVYPAEVEAVLMEHPAVAEVAVVGIPHERWGETGLAVVVRRGPVEAMALVDWCTERLARFKVPGSVRFLERLPRSSMGKVVAADLLALVSQETDDGR